MTDGDLRIELQTLRERVSLIELQVSGLEKSVERRLKHIEDNTTWIIRLILGTLIVAVLGFVFAGGLSVA